MMRHGSGHGEHGHVDENQMHLISDENPIGDRWKIDEETRVIGLAGIQEARRRLKVGVTRQPVGSGETRMPSAPARLRDAS